MILLEWLVEWEVCRLDPDRDSTYRCCSVSGSHSVTFGPYPFDKGQQFILFVDCRPGYHLAKSRSQAILHRAWHRVHRWCRWILHRPPLKSHRRRLPHHPRRLRDPDHRHWCYWRRPNLPYRRLVSWTSIQGCTKSTFWIDRPTSSSNIEALLAYLVISLPLSAFFLWKYYTKCH